LGWLGVALDQAAHDHRFDALVQEMRDARLADAVVLGVGGSSLCPDLLAHAFPAHRSPTSSPPTSTIAWPKLSAPRSPRPSGRPAASNQQSSGRHRHRRCPPRKPHSVPPA